MPAPRSPAPAWLGAPSGLLARCVDRLGMWMMLREHYGANYPLAPTQLTQVSIEPYLALSLERDRDRLYPTPAAPADARMHEVPSLLDDPRRRPLWLLRDVENGHGKIPLLRRDFAFASAHQPLFPDFAEQRKATPENDTVHGRIYSAAGTEPKRAVIVLHGFAACGLDSVARFTPAERMAAREIAVVMPALPYHAQRTPRYARFSGEHFMSGDVVRTFEAVLQAVCDLRSTIAWLQDSLGIEKVGLIGGSLGGYIATLTAAVEPRLAMLCAISPPIRISDNINAVPLGRYMRAGLEFQQVPSDVVERLQDLADPACFSPALETSRMRFIAGRNDLFVPRGHVERLATRWPGLQVDWHDWGHITVLLAWPPRRLYDEIEGFLDHLGF